MRSLGALAALLASLLLGGCSLFSKQNTRAAANELERVAKDWCLTIRASQVLCVYPLSEDVQVGDIYLVGTPLEQEAQEYERRGFLPFHTLMTRLQPAGYQRMYLDAYQTKDSYSILPHQWQFPPEPGASTTAWDAAPHAAFPSYTFSVSRGQGLKLAVPVQSVPIGLSLMNSGQAHGSIDIADASTYGIDQQSIDAQVDAWASCPDVRALLSRYEDRYLRVITRVYLTGKMNVSLQNDEQRGAGLDAGTAQGGVLGAFDAGASDNVARVASNYASLLGQLNAAIDAAKPGGSIRIAAVSSRGVSMSETFNRPVVVGYIAYDRPIGAGGRLGASTSTLLRMENPGLPAATNTSMPADSSTSFNADPNSAAIMAWLQTPGNREKLQEWLTAQQLDVTRIPSYIHGDFAALRQRVVDTFSIGGGCGTGNP